MQRTLGSIADRLVTLVVPKTSAGACCPPDPYYATCYCSGEYRYIKTCSYNCACKVFCGACFKNGYCAG